MKLDFFKGKKVLITGGAGLLGTNITQRLVSGGIQVQSTYFSRIPPEHLKKHYQCYDFTKYEDCLAATQNQDYVIICAVQASGVTGMAQSPTASILPNLEIHAGLLEACCQNEVDKAVWISSSTVYQEAPFPIKEEQLDLNQQPYDLYQGIGWVYRYIEQLVRCYYEKRGLQIGVLRTSNIYGPYDRFDDKKSHVIPALIKRALNKETPFFVWGDGETIRDFIYVDDLAEAVFKVLEGSCNGDPINFSNGTPVSIKEVVDTITNICEHTVVPQYDSTKPSAVPYRVLDNTKFNKILGNVEKTSLENGIKKTVDWYTSTLSRE